MLNGQSSSGMSRPSSSGRQSSSGRSKKAMVRRTPVSILRFFFTVPANPFPKWTFQRKRTEDSLTCSLTSAKECAEYDARAKYLPQRPRIRGPHHAPTIPKGNQVYPLQQPMKSTTVTIRLRPDETTILDTSQPHRIPTLLDYKGMATQTRRRGPRRSQIRIRHETRPTQHEYSDAGKIACLACVVKALLVGCQR